MTNDPNTLEGLLKSGALTPKEAAALFISHNIIADPIGAARCLLNVELWDLPPEEIARGHGCQAEVLRAVFKHRKVVVPSGHGVGKTFLNAGVLPILWCLSHPNSFVILTSASWENLVSKCFPTMHTAFQRAHVAIEAATNAKSWDIGKGWKYFGISADNPTNWHGYHPDGGLLLIVDEASKIEIPTFEAMISLLSSNRDHVLLAGNPIKASGPFAQTIRNPGSDWIVIRISSLDSPNIRAGKTVWEGLVDLTWLADAKEVYGEGSPQYGARVLGEIPDQDEDTFIPLSAIKETADHPKKQWQDDGPLRLAVDYAEKDAGDRGVFMIRGDSTVHLLKIVRGWDEMGFRGQIKKYLADFTLPGVKEKILQDRGLYIDERSFNVVMWKASRIKAILPDGTGMGAPLCKNLIKDGVPNVFPVIGAGRAHDIMTWANKRAESWGLAKAALATTHMPPDILRECLEMAALQYSLTDKGQVQLERKKVFIMREGKSPDVGDTFAMLHAREVGDEAFNFLREECHKMKHKPSIYERNETIETKRRWGQPKVKKSWFVHIEGIPNEHDRPGHLGRAIWVARKGLSVAVWVHIDRDGCWTVYRSHQRRQSPTPVFLAEITRHSEAETYMWNLCAVPETPEGGRDYGYVEEIIKACGSAVNIIEASQLRGNQGVEVIDRLLLAAFARVDKGRDKWWADQNADWELYLSQDMLFIWPDRVWEEFRDARSEQAGWTAERADEDPEGLISGGGPFLKCLRMIVLAGAARFGKGG